MKLIATFYSHFGATRFAKKCKSIGCNAKLMPVPRNLSSSCGTCVSYEYDSMCPVDKDEKIIFDEVEQIVEVIDDKYTVLYRAQNS